MMEQTSVGFSKNGLTALYFKVTDKLQDYGFSVLLFVMRCWMANVFFLSGLTKISNWDATLYLFKSEYMVPLLPPDIAAYLSTFNELFCPVLLVLGLATRFATIPMLAMTVIIQFTYEMNMEHLYWGFLLLTILFCGPGKISVDYWIRRKQIGNNA